MDKVVRDIKDFEKAVDELEESKNDHYSDEECLHITAFCLWALKFWIEEYKKQSLVLHRNLNQLQADFIDFDLADCAESNESWVKLQSTVNKWNEIALEGWKKENKSLLELVKFDQSEEGLKTLSLIKASTIFLGIWLSWIILRYILLFEQLGPDVMTRILNLIQETIRSRCLVKNSVINCRFLSVVEFLLKEMRKLQRDRMDVKQKTVENLSLGKRENDLLNLILFDVFYFETSHCCPLFPAVSANKGLRAFGCNVTQSFEPKLKNLSLKINEYAMGFASIHDEVWKRRKFVEMLDMGIKEIWNKLCL